MKIITNNKPRRMYALDELPVEAQAQFDYAIGRSGEHDPRFVRFKGGWIDAFDTQTIEVEASRPMGWAMHVQATDPLAQWNAIISDTYFSGILLRFDPQEPDFVIMGSYTS